MRFQIASNLVSLGFDQVKTESDAVVNKHMLKLLNSFIDAADALSPRLKSQVGVNDNTLANVLAARAQCRFAISQNGGLLERWCEKMLAFAQTQASEHAQDFSPQLASMLDAAEEIMEEVSDNLSDIRRAIPLKPDDMERALLGRKTNVAFAMMAQTMLLLRPLTLCTEACLRDVMGEQAAPLEMQEKMLYITLSPLLANIESFNRERWGNQISPVLKDAATVCLDLVAFAIDLSLPEPDANYSRENIESVRARIDSSVRECSALVHLIGEWQECYPAVGIENSLAALRVSSDLRPGDFVSVLAPSGLHVPAQIQEDGSATVSTAGGLHYKQVGDDFQLVEEIDSDTETESTDTASKPQSSKLTKAIDKAQLLLAPELLGQMARHLTTCKGLNNPDLVMPAYRLQAEKWQKQAERMNTMASRLDRFNAVSNTSDEQQVQLTDLAARLREQATNLTSKAGELTRPETRWSLIKAYARPQAKQLAELLEAGQISQVHKPTKLLTDPPDMLFEVKIQPTPDADGTAYPPVWLHLHTKKPMSLKAVRKGHAQHFEAVHLKSDIEKNRGANWIDAERASGRYDAAVHRSAVDAELLQGLVRFGKW
ncbi:MAG: hypothetical protein ACI802_003050 [Candidatus Paceibacteria bacterium]|jgi:hypothetical protein